MIRRQNRMKTSQIDAAMEMLRSKGRNGDTELAHVNPREKAILKALGGAGISGRSGRPWAWDWSLIRK
jgi:hypothetical protein